ncbi:MAG: signal peptidase II [Candidatus Woesearchaeota archaeon]
MKRKTASRQRFGKYQIYTLVLFLGVLAIDIISKHIVFYNGIKRDFGFFAINIVTNTGISFGLFQGNNTLFIIVSLAIFFALVYFFKCFNRRERYFAALIGAGLVGNMLDRIIRGFVIDFIDFKFWPAFNAADASIFIGVLGLIVLLVKSEIEKQKGPERQFSSRI